MILSPTLDEPGMGSTVRERKEVTESAMASPLTANEGSMEKITFPGNDTRNTPGTDPPDDSNTLSVANKSTNDRREGEEVPVGDTVAAGPPRVVPRPTMHGAEGALLGTGSARPATTVEAGKEGVNTSLPTCTS